VPKDKHGLVLGDISLGDKMNYSSVIKLIDPKVSFYLSQHVPGSEATILYLKLMRFTILPFVDEDMPPSERIYGIWYAVFITRIWRHHLTKINEKNRLDLFLSYNLYSCIELNAHALINLIIKLRYSNQLQLFQPTLFNSQVCESFFRRLRSMSTTSSTVVNFTLLDVSHKIKRIAAQNQITTNLAGKYVFPLEKSKLMEKTIVGLPDLEEIEEMVETAKRHAIEAVEPFIKIDRDETEYLLCGLEPITHSVDIMKGDKLDIESANIEENLADIITDVHILLENNAVDETLNLKEYAAGNI
jgi:hypothetical protein